MNNNLFEHMQKATDKTYISIRDNPKFSEQKNMAENMWKKFSPFADPHFKEEICLQFHQRFWEMYLGCSFMDMGFSLVSHRSSQGPDIHFEHNGKNIWVEAIAPNPGTGEDLVPDYLSGQAITVPEYQLILRLTSAFICKSKKFDQYLSQSIISPEDILIIAINGAEIPYCSLDDDIPYMAKALYPIGPRTVSIDILTKKLVKEYYRYQESVEKMSGSKIPTTYFSSQSYLNIFGVLFSKKDIWHITSHCGNDLIFFSNPHSKHKLEEGWIKCKYYKY
jgi:hypothetical protein